MKDEKRISEEIRKILSENFIKEAAKPGVEKENAAERAERAKVVDANATKLLSKDYLNTKEEDYLPFSRKVALVGGDEKDFLNLFKTAYKILKSEGKKPGEIVNKLAPGIPTQIIRGEKDLEDALTGAKVGKSKETGISQNYIDPSVDKTERGEEDIVKHHNEVLNHLEKYFSGIKGDEKSKIGYNFGADAHQLKLNPHGFWSIQFLATILKSNDKKPWVSQPEDAAFMTSNKMIAYQGRAQSILESFYKKAFKNMFLNLTGRYGGAHPNDVSFDILIDSAWDKVANNISKYDEKQQNFGAWAFSVARNTIIDGIRKFTNYEFKDDAESYNVFTMNQSANNDWTTWRFKKEMNIDPSYLIGPAKKVDGGFEYEFSSPELAYQFFSANKKIQDVFNSLLSQDRKKMNASGVLNSTRKDVGFEQGDEQPNTELYKTENFDELFDFLRTEMGVSFSDSIDKISKRDPEGVANALDKGVSQEDIIKSFKSDAGKLVYEVLSTIMPVYRWTSLPSVNVIQSLNKKYGANMSRPSSKSPYIKSDNYYDPKTGDLYPELQDFVAYDESASGKGIKEAWQSTLNEFNEKQQEKKNEGKLAFTFVASDLNVLGKAIQDIKSKKIPAKDDSERYSKLEKLSTILSNISGTEVMLEGVEELKKMRKHIRNMLKEAFYKKKTI